MKSASVHQIKQELKSKDPSELEDLILTLSKYKKDNKEYLTYLLFEQADENEYIQSIKELIEEQYASLNTSSYYLMKKTVRKVLRIIKKHIRYSNKKETEVELLLFFCRRMSEISPSIFESKVLNRLYFRQLDLAEKKLSTLHPDFQLDYREDLESLKQDQLRLSL